MLTLELGNQEFFDDSKQEFFTTPGSTFDFEHSLLAISKWESKYNIPFMTDGDKTQEQSLYYIECMCLTPGFDISMIDDDAMIAINDYLTATHTATTISNMDNSDSGKIITSEVLYSYLALCDIPFSSDTWNIDRLLTTVQTISALKSPPKKMTSDEVIQQNRELNEKRLKEMEERGEYVYAD